jgi:alkanesulfonate monooxygenase SsuD/methylene tetrahydromethanopterin reductase-like flavin-dependent oxidoreductase (luciferase family)
MICLRYDLRSAPDIGVPLDVVYRAALEQSAWADRELDVAQIRISEHHATDDGYCPSPLVAAAGFGAATNAARVVVCAVVLPLHDPVEIAEQVAVADLVAGGRLDVVFGAGYRTSEFAMFGRPIEGRIGDLEHGIRTLQRCWTGESFSLDGRTVRVSPRPVQSPHPPLYLGGSTAAAARRAARLGIGLMPGGRDEPLIEAFVEACRAEGRPSGPVIRSNPPMAVFVSDDPEHTWAQIAPFAVHEVRTYARWEAERPGNNGFAGLDVLSADDLAASGMYAIVTPGECVELFQGLGGGEALILHPLLSGLDPDVGWASLELFASEVLPQISPRAVQAGA